jgi:diguanylate cyclase (GGDEF)-like protein
MLLLGLVLSHILNTFIRERAIASAKQSIEVGAKVGIAPHITEANLEFGLSQGEYQALANALRGETLIEGTVAEYKIMNRDLEVVYSGNPAQIGDRANPTSPSGHALGGETEAVTTWSGEGNDAVQVLNVFVPLRFDTASAPSGVVEISLPYEPIATAISTDTRQLMLVVLGGLLIVYLALFRIVADASRKLRTQSEYNEYQAFHDVLTGLANRGLFYDRVHQALLVAEREDFIAGIMLMDLDRFKEINDTLGHHKGDLVLQQIARRLEQALRDTDTVARLGGDEFAVLLPNIPDPVAALNVAEKIREALNVPFVVEGMALDVRASIGISFFPGHGKEVELLVQRADVAMYLAKAAGTGCEIYTADRDQYSPNRLALVGELRRAIDDEEFILHYQPKVDLKTGQAVVVEALVRWDHPMRGVLPPAEFIGIAEHTGLIEPLTMYVLDKALRQVHQWRDDGIDLTVAVNMSPRNLLDMHFPDHVARMLTKWKLPPGCLQLEITESTLVHDPARALGILARLAQMRVDMAIDDFGTGYSSLGHLRKLPVKELKIDKSFVMNMEVDESDAVIVRSTIDLGRNLGLRVVAEGVETATVWHQLELLGCDYAQGFYKSRPMPAEQVPMWLMLTTPRWPL